MTPQMNETIPDSCNVELCEFRFGPGFGMEIASHTIEQHEPPFEEIKELCSDVPLRFYHCHSMANTDAIEVLEDQADLADAIESLKEPGSISLGDFKKQLGI
ncbi:MAG: hypothetical protein JW837_16425 [Sedimentisphaerales bacterium]|nr:hypothetical protein [Sedimentisphaerales bacterium]